MPALEDLARKLASSDPEERREAAVDLGRLGREALPLLFKAIGDPDWRVRKTAVEALVALGGEAVISGLIRCLSSHENAGMRNSSIEALVQLGAGAVEAVLAALNTPDADVRKFLVDTLGDIRDQRAAPALIASLDDEDENISVSAAEALGKIGDPSAVEPLIATLARTDRGWLDYAAAEALGEIGDDRALGPLLASLGRNSLREPVLESLGKIGGSSAVDALIEALSDKGWLNMPEGEGKPGTKKIWVRQKAIEALAKIGDARAVAPITEALNDKQEAVQKAAQKALQKLGTKTAG